VPTRVWSFSKLRDKNLKVLISVEAQDKASASLDRIKKRFSSLVGIDKHFSNVNREMRATTNAFDRFSNGFKNIGKNITLGISSPLALLSGLGVKVAADFEREMLKAKAATNGELFDQLKQVALAASSKSMFSPSEAAQGINWLGQGGMSSKDILHALNPTLELAASGETDLGYTADILGGILNTFGFQAKDSGTTVDKLVTTFAGSAQTLNDLGESIKYSGFMGRAANQDFDTVLFGLSALADSNIKGSEAGTGLSAVFEALINQEPKFINAWKNNRLGKDDLMQKGKIKPLLEIIKILKDKKVGARDLLQMFGVQGGRTMLGLIETPTKKLEEKFREISENHKGKGATFSKSRIEGFWGQLGILNSQLQTLSEKMFGSSGVLGGLTSVFTFLNEEIGKYTKDLDKETSQFNLKLIALTAIMGPLVFGAGLIISIFSAFLKWQYGMVGIGNVLWFLASKTTLLGATVAAVVTTMYLIIENWEKIRDSISSFWKRFKYFWMLDDFEAQGIHKELPTEYKKPKEFSFSKEIANLFTWKPSISKEKPSNFSNYGKPTYKTESTKGYEQKKTITINLEGLPKGASVEESGYLEDFTFNVGHALGGRG
jgi:TP901 family phage tail tape measure protein